MTDRDLTENMVQADGGGKKAQKRARFDLIPPDVMWLVAEQFGYGAEKYDDPADGTGPKAANWRKGNPYSAYMAAAERHYNAWKGGENHDPDDGGIGSHHLAAAIWHLICLLHYEINPAQYRQWDDREGCEIFGAVRVTEDDEGKTLRLSTGPSVVTIFLPNQEDDVELLQFDQAEDLNVLTGNGVFIAMPDDMDSNDA